MSGPGHSRAGLRAASVLFGLMLAVAACEGILRLTGRAPAIEAVTPGEPVMHEPDPVLGWRARAGSYDVPPYAPGGQPIRMTFRADGSRRTAEADAVGRPQLVLVGGSFIQGWAISDEETLAWEIQRRRPDWEVANFGTAGYGTYQSLLVLERLFSGPAPPDAVLYGFIGDHEIRNVAPPSWLLLLAAIPRRGIVAVPYCTLDAEGALVRNPPDQQAPWPLRRHLALAAFLEQATTAARSRRRSEQARDVTDRLLVEMERLVRGHGARFAIVFLGFSRPGVFAHYRSLLDEQGIDFANCAFPITEEMKVVGEGHPNAAMNARWARCVEQKLGASWPSAAPPRSTKPEARAGPRAAGRSA